MWYMYKNKVCTLIDVDEVKQIVRIKNCADNIMFRAFGSNQNPDIEVLFYDPYLIIQKTGGRMAEDDFWIRIEK